MLSKSKSQLLVGGMADVSLEAISDSVQGLDVNSSPTNLIGFLEMACRQLRDQLAEPWSLRFIVDYRAELVSQVSVGGRRRKDHGAMAKPIDHAHPDKDSEVVVKLLKDSGGRVVQFSLVQQRFVPLVLLRVLALALPYQLALARLAVVRSQIDGVALYEISKILLISQVTELVLDDSPVAALNYHLLLERRSHLRLLSLDRCRVGAAGCARLAAALTPHAPAASTLAVLALAGNRVGDEGARALAAALRSNRTLRYLSLADNGVTDEGAAAILEVLEDFPLTAEETEAERLRRMQHARRKRAAFDRMQSELMRQARAVGAAKTLGRGRGAIRRMHAAESDIALETRATELAGEEAGPSPALWKDPLESRDGRVYVSGNHTLSCLNLAYNDLSWYSARLLVRVVRAQRARRDARGPAAGATAGSGSGSGPTAAPRGQVSQSPSTAGWWGARAGAEARGLLRVVLAGNPLPACAELAEAAQLLDAAAAGAVPASATKPKSRRL